MTDLTLSASRPDGWSELNHARDALFGTGPWLDLLEQSFGCRTVYASNGSEGFAVTVFRAGPFKIGYLGFPLGGGLGGNASLPRLIDTLGNTGFRGLPICMRMPVSAFGKDLVFDLPCQSNPETAIMNLQDWQLESISKNLRRDIRKSQRSGLQVSEATDPGVGDSLYAIYSRTVKRHGGALRYNARYFRELIKLSTAQPRVKVLLARQGTDIAGFAVMARHQDTAYYLHGGADPRYRTSSPSDVLVNQAIHLAQQEGSQTFNLMASPPDQPSLVRYKEKWGGVTRDLKTYTVKIRPTYHLFRFLEKLYSLAR